MYLLEQSQQPLTLLARSLAEEVHEGQLTKYGEPLPYFEAHVSEVVKVCEKWFPNPNIPSPYILALIWLHDSIEDSKDKWSVLARIRGLSFDLALEVLAITKFKYETRGLTNHHYNAQLVGASWVVQWAKLCDIHVNTRDIYSKTRNSPRESSFANLYLEEKKDQLGCLFKVNQTELGKVTAKNIKESLNALNVSAER